MRHLPFYPRLPMLPQAACMGFSMPDLFFPTTREEVETWSPIVKATCNACVENTACLEYALAEQIEHGIWAGKTPEERNLIIEARLRKSAAQSKGAIQSTHTTNEHLEESCSLLESRQ